MSRARILADYVAGGTTAAEFDYLDGVTSNVQTQLTAKAPLASPTFTGTTTVSGDLVPSTPLSHRNMIINGGMQVWQRATSATAASGYNTADRWQILEGTDGAYTSEKHDMSIVDKNTTGHAHALKLVCTSADTSLASGVYAYLKHHIEASTLQHLRYGGSNAKTLTLSFWVKSSLTGTYAIMLSKQQNTTYHYVREYSIDSADTWEQKTITITPTAGSTTLITNSGAAMDSNNASGLFLGISLGFGSNYHGTDDTWTASAHYSTSSAVNWMSSSSSRDFYITGIQLELGSSATPFEHRSYGEELRRCQRYFVDLGDRGQYTQYSSAYRVLKTSFPVVMRTTPTVDTRTSTGTSAGTNIDPYFYEEYMSQAYNVNSSFHMTVLKMTAEL
jgi:hypothetical protein